MATAAFEQGLAWIETLPVTDRVSFITRLRRAATLFYMGRYDEADTLLATLTAQDPTDRAARLFASLTAAALGRTDDADRTLAYLRENDETPYSHGDNLRDAAEIAAQLGRVDEAIGLLQLAFKEGLRYGTWLHEDPVFDPVREDPRFRRLAEPNG